MPCALVCSSASRSDRTPHRFGFGRFYGLEPPRSLTLGASAHDGDPPVTELGGEGFFFGDFIPLEIAATGRNCESRANPWGGRSAKQRPRRPLVSCGGV